jgi:2-oxoglutarate dehydrogenase E2 component (dihydrolipoamide succinyltransferase)
MSEEKNPSNSTEPSTPTAVNATPTTENKQTEGPLLLEIKAAVEKLAGEVRSITERLNKAEKKPEDKQPPRKSDEVEAAEKKPDEEKKPEEKQDKKPDEEKKPKEEQKAKPEEYPYPKKEDHGCSADEEWDEGQSKCVPKASKQDKKPEEYPYPGGEKPKKSTDIVAEQFAELQSQVTGIQKALGIPPMKRTSVVRKEDMDKPIDVSGMSWPQIHELARPVDLRRGA